MSAQFCNIFDTEVGQILVKVDRNEEGKPEVRFYVQPEDLGVCSVATSYEDSDEGWDRAEKLFGDVDKELAVRSVQYILAMQREAKAEEGKNI